MLLCKKMKRTIKKNSYIITSLLAFSNGVNAQFSYDEGQASNIGDASRNISSALNSVTDLVLTVLILTGIGFLVAALFKWDQHRKNPQQITISQVLVMIIMGVVMIGVPFILKYGGSAYNVIKEVL